MFDPMSETYSNPYTAINELGFKIFKTELTNETQAIARYRVIIKRQLRKVNTAEGWNFVSFCNNDSTERLEKLLDYCKRHGKV
jgi:hypothetical protein